MHGNDTAELNISLEPHLLEALRPLSCLLPSNIANELRNYISDAPTDIVPYSTLLAISQWSRSPEGRKALEAHAPPLDANSYSMVSLLAGVKTSPERNFGAYRPPPEPEQRAKQQARERKEITAIINALLSIVGVGFSTWWAADKLHWKDQWRILLALSASLVVAMAEGGLFLIWRSRQGASVSLRKTRREAMVAIHKKVDDYGTNETQTITKSRQPTAEPSAPPGSNLRQRRL